MTHEEELIDLAAKATGRDGVWMEWTDADGGNRRKELMVLRGLGFVREAWNPLVHNDQCFELMVEQGMSVMTHDVIKYAKTRNGRTMGSKFVGLASAALNDLAATRKAIVLAIVENYKRQQTEEKKG